ncbi:hypothetical protein [Sebaldella sp. S0638]|uniref:hypothetical protein n=1 Tax=Sebaldella sp. S0638 TaxID=2957809 RepID=UPI00209FE9AD|nr:hypothetical protein [Sebaldella sp. S0638]MCP1226425.1 hypothetical protein [Sebaldella sp. S0638]
MKKIIFIMLALFSTFLIAEKTPTYSNLNDIKSFSFYSGNTLNKIDSLIAVIPSKNKYYVNADKLKTNLDIYTVNSIINSSNRLLEISKNKDFNIKSAILMNTPITIDRVQKKKFNTISLNDGFIEDMFKRASENENFLTTTPEQDIIFININLP